MTRDDLLELAALWNSNARISPSPDKAYAVAAGLATEANGVGRE